jgi:hypothetical protein
MILVTIGDYIVRMRECIPEGYGEHAALVEEFDLDRTDRSPFYLAISRPSDWPFLCVAQRYYPDDRAGSHPGILLVQETDILFVGAGERLLTYDLKAPARLWEDRADVGFHWWHRHDEVVLMAGELDLSAWDIRGVKRWSVVVEPPWEYYL